MLLWFGYDLVGMEDGDEKREILRTRISLRER